MNSHNAFRKYVIFVLVNIFLVIIAGSIVRSTQSGMGCPDWPKCFGQYIPPTAMEQVLFQPNKTYGKGQFVRYNDSLWSAAQRFTSSANFNYTEWKHYNKHGYTKVVIYQTWIEYVNRLLGALLGLLVLAQAIWSLQFRKQRPALIWLSIALVVLTGFQAWLGKTVVDSNLAVVKISIHLAGAIALCLVQVYILHLLRPSHLGVSKKVSLLVNLLSIASIVQFFMGVLIRQRVDAIAEQYNYTQRGQWLNDIGIGFYVHRSFSLALLALVIYLFTTTAGKFRNSFKPILYLVLAQLVLGILFNYAAFPAFAQPLHLVLASMQLSYLFYLMLAKKEELI